MPKPKTALELKHEEASRHAKSLTALKRHRLTPEGIKQAADSAEWSETCRAEWMRLEAQKKAIKLLPRNPRLVVTGGRCFAEQHDVSGKEVKPLTEALEERRALAWVLDMIAPSCVINGGAHGADRWVRIWADKRGVECVTVMADWDLGHRAGPLRNQRMIDEHAPTAGVRFPGGSGSDDCHKRMLAGGLPVFVAKMGSAPQG